MLNIELPFRSSRDKQLSARMAAELQQSLLPAVLPHESVRDDIARKITSLSIRRDNLEEEIKKLTEELDSTMRAIVALTGALNQLEQKS